MVDEQNLRQLAEASNLAIRERADMSEAEFSASEDKRREFRRTAPDAILSLLDELQTLREERTSMLQAITDPENQPSQYGTVTLDYHAQKVSELSDKYNTSVDALIAVREERTAWRVTAENAEAAAKQARIDAHRFALALVSVMDGMKDYDIRGETGLPDEECEQIADTRRAAIESLKEAP